MSDTLNANQTWNVHTTRIFDAPIAQVWQAWSDGVLVMRWWGPHNWTSPVCNMNFYEGGKTLVSMRAPQEMGGFDMFNTWTYTKIVPHERIEFTNNFSDANGTKLDPTTLGLPAEIPSDVPHVITLQSLPDNKTQLTVTEYGYTSPQVMEMSKSGLEECLDKMEMALDKF